MSQTRQGTIETQRVVIGNEKGKRGLVKEDMGMDVLALPFQNIGWIADDGREWLMAPCVCFRADDRGDGETSSCREEGRYGPCGFVKEVHLPCGYIKAVEAEILFRQRKGDCRDIPGLHPCGREGMFACQGDATAAGADIEDGSVRRGAAKDKGGESLCLRAWDEGATVSFDCESAESGMPEHILHGLPV